MEGCIKLVESSNSQNEIKVVEGLQNFVYENEKTFSFRHLEPSSRRKFIDTLLTKLSVGNCGSELKTQALSALRILSRDKDVLGVLTSERSIFTLLLLAELSTEGFSTGKDGSTSSREDEHNKNNSLDNISGKASVVVGALKCLCNVVFHSKTSRQHCFKHKAIEAIIARVKRWFDNTGLVTDVKYFDLRFLFLLTALENFARDDVVAHNGFCVLTHALDSCIPGKEERKICHEAKVTDGCGQLTGSKLQALSLLERSSIEENPQLYSMTEDEIRLSAELLKTMFNISLRLSDTDDSDTIEHCERIVFIIRSMFVHIKGLTDSPENLPTHAVNLASNMPRSCLKHLYWSIPSNVSRKLAKEHESKPSSKKFRIHFENYNMLSVQHMLIVLDDRLKSTGPPPKDHLVSALSAFCQLARGNRLIRKYLRQEVLPPLGRVGTTRPEEGNLIRNRLVRLMTSPLEDIKELVADFLFVLCKENVNRLVKYTGYGNAAGLLASRGLMGGGQGHECEYSSDEGDSETEEYAMDKSQIDPMIGAIPVDDGKPNPLDEMTEEEKEEEAEKLAKLIQDLNRKGVIKTAQVGPDGRPQEIPELSKLQDKNRAESSEGNQKDEDEKRQENICSVQSTQTESEGGEPQIKRPETEGE